MKKIKKFAQLNESASEMTLLNNLFSFYYAKFKDNPSELETHFVDVAKTLVQKDEITQASLDKFCKEKDITLEEDGIDVAKEIQSDRAELKKKYSRDSGSSSSTDSCGNSFRRSYC